MLDLRTINIVTGLMGLLMAAVLLGMRHYYPGRVRGALLWGLSPIVGAGSALAYSLDSVLPPVLVVVFGNGLAFGSAALNLFGSAAFHGHVLNGRRWLVFTATVMVLLFCFIAVWPDYRVRVVVAALAMAVFTGVHAWLHWRSVRSFAVRFLVLVLVIRCVILLVRVVSAPFTETASATIFHASAIQALHLGSYSVGGMLTCLGLVLLASERIRAEFERLANTDLLTGAASRRAIMQSIEAELERWRRTGRVFSVLLIDIDHFKRINDSFGHATGDLVLAHFAASIKPTLRAIDTLGRWGGEEFLVLLPESDVDDAALVAERVREVVQGCAVRAGLPACTTSIGCASIATSGPTLAGLLAQADAALYRAKHDGRNCVRVA